MSLYKDHLTIYDIARKAGVSTATVSRVLTGKTFVKNATRVKVQKIIDDYHYRPNLIARSLHNKISKTIGLVVQSLVNPFFARICHEAEIYASKVGYTLIIGITNNRFEMETKLLSIFEKRQVDGFIFLGGRINEVKPEEYLQKEIGEYAGRVPVVFINGGFKFHNCYRVQTDEKKAFEKLLNYVIDCGHKKIGLITGQTGLWPTEKKLIFFNKLINQKNLELNQKWIICGEYNVKSGEESMQQLLEQEDHPTVVLCANDILAMGAIRKAIQMGLKVPADICVTGFDDIDFAQYCIPGITTVRHNYAALVKEAVNKIIRHIKHKRVARETMVDARCIIRESCCKIESS